MMDELAERKADVEQLHRHLGRARASNSEQRDALVEAWRAKTQVRTSPA